MSVHKKAKMLQENHPPALTILRGYMPVWTQYIQKVILVYDSIVHTSYMGCIDRHAWKLYTQIISSTHVQQRCKVCACIYTVWTCICNVCTWYILDLTGCSYRRLMTDSEQETDDRVRQTRKEAALKERSLRWAETHLRRKADRAFTIMNVHVQCTYITLHS